MKNAKLSAMMITCVLLLFFMSAAAAQNADNVSGHVSDAQTGQPIQYATFDITNVNTNVNYGGQTDSNGDYSFYLPPGDYHSTCFANGYQESDRDFSIGSSVYTRDIQLVPSGGSTGGDTNNDDSSNSDIPFGDIDEDAITNIITVLVTLTIVFFICLITITIALIVISVRLGKIRKELIALNESQRPRAEQQQPPPPPPSY